MLFEFSDEFVVVGRRHQRSQVGGQIAWLDLEEPGIVGALVDDFRRVFERAIHLDYLAADRRQHILRRLDRLHGGRLLAGRDRFAHFRQVHVDDVAQCILGVVGDADDDDVALDARPFVALGIFDALIQLVA